MTKFSPAQHDKHERPGQGWITLLCGLLCGLLSGCWVGA